ncbi:MAG: IPT/TIG domain-containing protein [Gemmatimonadaceae bacterium]
MSPDLSRSRRRRVAAFLVVVTGACGGGDTTAPPPQVPTSIVVQPQSWTFGSLGEAKNLVATVRDQHGDSIHGSTVVWHSSDESIVTVTTGGMATAVMNGATMIGATSGTLTTSAAIMVAQVPQKMVKVSGDSQTARMGQALAAPLVVRATDLNNHAVAGVTVRFALSNGADGSVAPDSGVTDSVGEIQARWTLGFNSLAPMVLAKAAGENGGAATFSASAQPLVPAPVITSVSPDTLVEGQQATINGANFSATADSNVVVVDGDTAQVIARTPSSLTVRIATSACKPVRLASVSVSVGPQSGSHDLVPLRPTGSSLTLAVGQETILRNPGQFCLRFAPSTGPQETYLMGLTAPAETPGVVSPFEVVATGGIAASPSIVASSPGISANRAFGLPSRGRAVRGGAMPALLRDAIERRRGQLEVDLRIREWEAAHLTRRVTRNRSAAAVDVRGVAAAVAPNVGDTLTLHVPNLTASDLCSSFNVIRGVVRAVGSAGIWVEDAANPTADSLTQADVQAASNQFDARIYATDTAYFGHPSDIDGNGRAIILLTRQVNTIPRLLGFVFLGDLVPTSLCAGSNGAEIYYGEVPDPDNAVGGGARSRSTVVAEMPELIAHEFTHVIQYSQRLILNDGAPMAGWEMEGQATLAEELAGHATLGNAAYQNYGAEVAFSVAGSAWYTDEIVKLASYFGDLGSGFQSPDAPDQCTVYGSTNLAVPCDFAAFYGASWILQRYINDQYGPGYPGGVAQLTRDWVARNIQLSGTANIAALLGVDYDSLFVRFATALALDDQDNGTGTAWIPPAFRITSWHSASLEDFLAGHGLGWLRAPAMQF